MAKVARRVCHICEDAMGPLEPYFVWVRPATRQKRYWCPTCLQAHFGYDWHGFPVFIPLAWVENDQAERGQGPEGERERAHS